MVCVFSLSYHYVLEAGCMLTLFAISLFLSAVLLFLVQPMIAKMVLPLLGGTPAVWNTCMLFFQVMLLAGYGYVHAFTTRVSIRRQVSVHLMLLCAPLLLLPIGVTSHWMVLDPDRPISWLLGLLTLSVGLPWNWAYVWTNGGVRHDVAWAFFLGLITFGLVWLSMSTGQGPPVLASLSPSLFQDIDSVSRLVDVPSKQLVALMASGLPLLLCYGCVARPLRLGLGLGAILLVSSYSAALHDDVILYQERTFFSVLKVERSQEENWHKLLHGATSHGKQSLDPSRRDDPLIYYHREGPIGQAFAKW
jgi:hypothetical protein